MIGHSNTRNILASAALAFIVIAPMTPTSASAQGLSWLWGGGSEVGGSGKEVVAFGAQHRPGQIIVSFSDRRLYYVTRPGEALSYPIASPRDQSRWQGTLQVSSKRVDPPWTPTAEMIRENPKLPRHVPGGHPMNPMGVRALYLGATMYRIHGTDAPWSIGQAVSKGCIRMYNKDVVDLYDRVPVGSRVTVTWNSYKTGQAVAVNTAATPTPASSSSQQTSGFNAFTFPWFDAQQAAPPRPLAPMKERVQKKRRPTPSTVGTTPAPGKQVEAPAESVTASVAPRAQPEKAH
jgi:lipoprotein-anchoring transpeptidase ErfK/SrfK